MFALAALWLLSGCAYRFTNTHVARPTGIHTIAVEAIFDTSREVLPHELLWESLQNAIASDGHLHLAPQSSADALMRAQIKQASVAPTGGNVIHDIAADGTYKVQDPTPFANGVPPKPSDFRRLTEAGEYQAYGQVTLVVEIEVFDLNTRALLLRKTYPIAGTFNGIHSAVNSSSVANDHLRYDEAARANFKTLTAQVADSVVRDLIVR